ncbi:hypothetical protein GGI25_005758 [Coemansia spiralis]|uniref:Uncharacterized protein n=2 Tax=Coemansia TaxID=4863 RepID=A0A9W8G1R8_9FUNG|nr:hypothetical protein EDC05_006304 [Coemansia umbellata]KAJ2618620.1 hypothetical protein GGI26_006467 [Coemansia sp. RSA 1358]KAJ2670706.1 hypothetical protein GGI25_005758 [Coemansia spiralis]
MPTTPMPASFRKRSEQYAKNVNKRGHVKKSLDPMVEKRLEAERLRKKGLGNSVPPLVSKSRRVLLVLLALVLGSALYQILQPLFGSSSDSNSSRGSSRKAKAPTQESELTREQQAKAAEAVLRAMNQQAQRKYMENAKNYKGERDIDDDDIVSIAFAAAEAASGDEKPVAEAEAQLF